MKRKASRYPISVTATVPVDPSRTIEQQYQDWLPTVSPPRCSYHPNATTIAAGPRRKLRGPAEPMFFRVREEAGEQYFFKARFGCPQCRLVLAEAPLLFQQSDFATFQADTQEQKLNLAACRKFVEQVNENGRGFLVMVGRPGTGKTLLAASIIQAVDIGALYKRQGTITLAIRQSYNHRVVDHRIAQRRRHDEDDEDDDGDETVTDETPIWRACQLAGLFVLDELGCTEMAKDEIITLDEIIKERIDQARPTILISNLPATGQTGSLKSFLGDALADRLHEATGRGRFFLQFGEESYRRKGPQDYLSGPREC